MRKLLVLLLALLASPAAAQIQRVQGCKSGATCDPIAVSVSSGGGGDATAANQVTEIARLTSILTALGGGLPSALLSGALNVSSNVLATAALQTTGNGYLTSIDSTLSTVSATLTAFSAKFSSLGQKTSANSVSVVPASDATFSVSGPLTDTQLRASPVPVSGTVTATISGVATAANQTTLGSQTTKLNDGTSTATVKAASTVAVATDTALVVAVSPNNTPVLPSGASTAAKQPALGTAGTPSADVITVQGASGMTAFKVDGSAVTQPVSGTVSVSGVATATNQTSGGQKTQVVDASGNVQPAGDIAARAIKVDGSAVTQPISGTVTVTPSGTQTVAGANSDNSTNSTTKLATLPARANAAAPTWTEGNQIPLSVDLTARLRTTPTGTLTPADGTASPTTLIGTQAYLMGFNPNTSQWDRLYLEGVAADGDNSPTAGVLSVEGYNRIFNGTTWDRIRSAGASTGSMRVLPHDGTNGAAITAASTAASAANPALVVALSPNSPPPKEADVTCSATLTNGSPTLTCSTLQGVGALGFYLAYGAGGTIATQATYDGTNYFAVSACPPSAPSSGCVSSLSATGQYVIPLAAYSAVRFSGSGLSGSHTVTARATAKTGWVQPTGVTTVTASSLPLPTGAANAVAQGSTTSGQTGELVQAAVTTNAPTYTNGQTSPINMGTSGGLRTQQIGDSFTWLSAAGSYGIRTGAGILRRVIVGSNVAGGINCYDNTAGSGTVIVSLTTTTSTPFNYVEVGAAFSTGLYCVTTGAGQSLTVVYAPAT